MNCIDKLIIILFTIILMGLSSLNTYFRMKRKYEDEILSIKSKSINELISSFSLKEGEKLILNAEIIDSSGNTVDKENDTFIHHQLALIKVPLSIANNVESLSPMMSSLNVNTKGYKTTLCVDIINKKAVITDESGAKYNIEYNNDYSKMKLMLVKAIEGEEFRKMKNGTIMVNPEYINSDKPFNITSLDVAYEKTCSFSIKDENIKFIKYKKDKEIEIIDEEKSEEIEEDSFKAETHSIKKKDKKETKKNKKETKKDKKENLDKDNIV